MLRSCPNRDLKEIGAVSLELRGGSELEAQTEEASVYKYPVAPWG